MPIVNSVIDYFVNNFEIVFIGFSNRYANGHLSISIGDGPHWHLRNMIKAASEYMIKLAGAQDHPKLDTASSIVALIACLIIKDYMDRH
jgi:hypothetical protein